MRGGEEGKGGERKGREEGGRGDNVEAQGQGRKGMRREKREERLPLNTDLFSGPC